MRLLVGFGVTSWAAVRHKSATYDEPMTRWGRMCCPKCDDYRINPEDHTIVAAVGVAGVVAAGISRSMFGIRFTRRSWAQLVRWAWTFKHVVFDAGE